MNHIEAQPLLDAYLDHELDLAAALPLERHLQECAECRDRLTARHLLQAKIRAAPLRYPVPPHLSLRISRRIPSGPASARWPRALAAGLLLAIAAVSGGFFLGRSSLPSADLRAELINAHVRSVLSTHAIDVVSSDHHTVKPWLSNQLPFSPPVPELTAQGDVLLGARVDYLGRKRMAVLVYQHGNHRVDVFVWPRTAEQLGEAANSPIEGFRIVTGTVGDFEVAMVSDLSDAELAAFYQRWLMRAGEP